MIESRKSEDSHRNTIAEESILERGLGIYKFETRLPCTDRVSVDLVVEVGVLSVTCVCVCVFVFCMCEY